MRIDHRRRLAVVSAAASGGVLATLFVVVVLVARANAYRSLTTQMAESMRTFTLDPSEAFDEREFRIAYPDLEARQSARSPEGIVPDGIAIRSHHRILMARSFRGRFLIVTADWEPSERSLRLLAWVLGGLWPMLTLMVGVSTWLAARAVFRPLRRLSEQASAFAGADLGERLSTDDAYEFGEFADSLNGMLERIEAEVRRNDRFAADAAHELRTPLAILRTRIDTALLSPRTSDEYAETLRRARLEIVRLTDVVQALLRTARGELPEAPPVNLAAAVGEAADAWRDRFAERGVTLTATLGQARSAILPEEVRMVVDNLLDNALRFSPMGSSVRVTLDVQGTEALLTMEDQGPGFPAEMSERAFDRLARGDDSRNRASGGAGIGLSVVRQTVRSRGGEATITLGVAGGTVVVRLPIGATENFD